MLKIKEKKICYSSVKMKPLKEVGTGEKQTKDACECGEEHEVGMCWQWKC